MAKLDADGLREVWRHETGGLTPLEEVICQEALAEGRDDAVSVAGHLSVLSLRIAVVVAEIRAGLLLHKPAPTQPCLDSWHREPASYRGALPACPACGGTR